MPNIAAVIILYNPEFSVLANIESYINQVDKLFVVDNSDKINKLLIQKVQLLNNVEYISNNCNLGIAAALNIGAERSIAQGFKYILTMDQDSEASPSLVTRLLEVFSIDPKIALVSPIVYHRNGKNLVNKAKKSFEQTITNWTSGSLLSLDIFKKTNGFKEELFIDYVDHEFCLQLNKLGYKIFVCNETFIKHSLGKIEEINLVYRKVYPTNHPAIRLYYRARNRFYIKKIYKKVCPEFFKEDNRHFWKSFIKVILFEKHKFEKIKYFLWGYMDYRKNKFGKFGE